MTNKETITTYPRVLSNLITYEEHNIYIFRKTFMRYKTIKYVSTVAKELNDTQVNELVYSSRAPTPGLYVIPSKKWFCDKR